jgi:hypothetical protein
MIAEHVVHQVNAALRCVDGNSGRPLSAPQITAAGVRLVRNQGGGFVLMDRTEPGDLVLQVTDPSGAYLPRRLRLELPRDPDPAHSEDPSSLFRPVDVALYSAPATLAPSGWAVVRATVVDAATNAPLPGALLRLVRSADGRVLGRGIADWRGRVAGEALIAVPGVPAITFGPGNGDDGAVLVSQIAATVEAIYDPAAELPPDPDDLEQRRALLPQASQALLVGAGRSTTVRIAVALA